MPSRGGCHRFVGADRPGRADAAPEAPAAAPSGKAGRYRWVVCGLLFAATAVNYIDRQMIGVLKPTLQTEFGWDENAYSTIILWFQLAYALGYLSFGRIVDKLGARAGYAIAIVIWTIGHMAHGFASGVASFAAARFGLGVGESGNFPAGIRAVADWFPSASVLWPSAFSTRVPTLARSSPLAGARTGAVVRLAHRLLRHRHLWPGVAGGMVGALSPSFGPPACHAGRA
jgi:MFS family permease